MTPVQRLLFVVTVLILAFADAIRALPEPSLDPVALCPNVAKQSSASYTAGADVSRISQ